MHSVYNGGDPSNDTCIDIDECADYQTLTNCSFVPEGFCVNNDGSYECECPQGMGGSATVQGMFDKFNFYYQFKEK